MTISRRNFINSAASFAAITASSSLPLIAKPKKKLGVALLGLGYYSKDLLAPALQLTQHCELRGIITGTPAKIPQWQKQYQIKDANVYSYENMHTIANNPDIDVVYVVTPTGTHKKFSVAAANAGKHVWCEKPMAMTVSECEDIIAACRKNKVRLSVGYRMQHEANTQTVIGYATSKPFGNIKNLIAKAGYAGGIPSPDNWRSKREMGGGALYDMGVYVINAARYTSGLEPVSVKANMTVNRKQGFKHVDETTYLTLNFPDNIVADCATSVGERFNLLRANCKKGWYELSPMQRYNGVKGIRSDGKALDLFVANQQAVQMDNDALAIMNKTPMIVDGQEGLKDIHIVTSAIKSHETGKTVTL